MKIVHWTMMNNSGMHNVATSMCIAEQALGLVSSLANSFASVSELDSFLDADVHVTHTYLPIEFKKKITKKAKFVYVVHGTPEHIFHSAVEAGQVKSHGMCDHLMLLMHGLQTSDCVITFWPRHESIFRSMSDKHTRIETIPLGVDRSFWKPIPSLGAYDGTPSILTCENPAYIKWPLDLINAWPLTYPTLPGKPMLHCLYMPNDMQRWFLSLANRNGCAYAAHFSAVVLSHDSLRNAFNSVNFYIGLVRYGDFNRLSLEANASGATTISYAGNPYSDYWLPEGDHRNLAEQLGFILRGDWPKRDKAKVPDISETAQAMKQVYDTL